MREVLRQKNSLKHRGSSTQTPSGSIGGRGRHGRHVSASNIYIPVISSLLHVTLDLILTWQEPVAPCEPRHASGGPELALALAFLSPAPRHQAV